MATWRVWIGSSRADPAEWNRYVVTATDQSQAIHEVYKRITGLICKPTPGWIRWHVKNVELLADPSPLTERPGRT